MKKLAFASLLCGGLLACTIPALADQTRLPGEINGIENERDCNMFQVEPTILNEHYYISGKDERHQFVGNTLPAGAPIPDTDAPVPVSMGIGPSNAQVAPRAVSRSASAPSVQGALERPAVQLPSQAH
jgi:hypothetical protein